DAKVEWNEAESFIYGDNKPFIGPDAVVNGVFAKIGGEWDGFTITNLQVINMDNGMVLATGRYQAKYKKNGAVLDAQMAHVWTLKDGKIVKFQQYTDTKQFAEVIKK
ncbi:MAG: nuclear transport factor 2 family protein, partial [Chitinophagaceae bacterium]|nr:nuclear transport factor 2 family protein [Chitinophagaceae bacterium]